MECLVYTANAFTADGKNGNGAGIVLEAESLSPEQMLSIAKQVGFSETAFVSEHNRPVRKLHFFTPVQEVPLCGHATIATWSLLHMRGSAPAGDYVQETGAGLLRVCVQQDGLIFMEQAAPEFLDVVPPKRLASLLNLTLEDFIRHYLHALSRPA